MANHTKTLVLALIIVGVIAVSSILYSYTALSSQGSELKRIRGDLEALSEKIDRLSSDIAEVSRLSKGITEEIESLKRGVESVRGDVERFKAEVSEELRGLRSFIEASTSPRISVEYARLFSVTYDGVAKVVRDAENQVILLLPKDLDLSQEVVDSYREKYDPDYIIYTPVERAVLMSATQVSMIYRLELECGVDILSRNIAGIMWGGAYKWYIDRVSDLLDRGVIKDVGGASNPDIESIIALNPDLVLIYTYPGSPVFTSLKEANLPVVVDNEYLENSLLGRFEWIKFISLFFNLEECAERVFSDVERRISDVVSQIKAALPLEDERPMVAWLLVWGGRIYAAKPGSYVEDLITLAGGVYAFRDIPYGAVTVELAISRGPDIDVLIYSSSREFAPGTLRELVESVDFLKYFRAVEKGSVYVFAPDYYQLGTSYPDILVMDLAKILYPDLAAVKDHEVRFFEKLK